MASSHTVVIAGAGIGGLTAALTIARHGYRVVLLEQAERLEETGAGIQLSPNASRILMGLGLRERLMPHVSTPRQLMIANADSGRVLARAPLAAEIERRYGAPYWVIHRGDLQTALREAAAADPAIVLRLGSQVEDFLAHADGVTVKARCGAETVEEHGIALIGADGLWSRLRQRLGHGAAPRFAGAAAWRALVPADAIPGELSAPAVNLWFGRDGHVVHYPIKAGRLINVVAILCDEWREPGWSAPGDRDELLRRVDAPDWRGPVTLLGDAAHPLLPYLAQGAAMAIEDAAELGQCLAGAHREAAPALRLYERRRLARTARTQRAARRNGVIYHMGGLAAFARTLALSAIGGEGLIARHDWLYGFAPTT